MKHGKPSISVFIGWRKNVRQKMYDPLMAVVFEENKLRRPIVAHVGVASSDDEDFFQYMLKILKESGAGKVQQGLIFSEDSDLYLSKKL